MGNCCRSDIDSLFFLVQVVVFRLPETFNSLAIDGEFEQIHLSHSTFFTKQMRTVCPHVTHDVTRSRVAQVQVVPSTK